ncbi:MAG: O-antigen ligase family protein, partial [Caldilineaceae bacterium]|nr:O-antigen ligase family protein [Caldilineaceae bacterium]
AYQGLVLFVAAVVFFYQQMLRGNLERAALWMSMVLLLMNVVGHARVHMVGFNLESWHTNSYSAVAAMLAAYCLGELWSARGKLDKRRRRLLKTCLVIALFFLVLGTSGGSNVAFALGVIGALLYSAKRKLKAFAIPLIAVAVVVYLVIPEFLVAVLLPGKTVESVETLTGRTRIWELYWDMFLANRILGVGFGVPERVASLYTTNTHNIVIGIAAALGMFGLTFFLLYLFSLAKRLLGMHSKVGYAGVACAIGVGLVNGMTVGFLTSGSGPAFMAFAIWNAVLVLKPLAVERETREQESRPAEVGPAAWPRTASQRAR